MTFTVNWDIPFADVIHAWRNGSNLPMDPSFGWEIRSVPKTDRLRVYSVTRGVVADFIRNPFGGPWLVEGWSVPVPTPLREQHEYSTGPDLTYLGNVSEDVLESFILASEVSLSYQQNTPMFSTRMHEENWSAELPFEIPKEMLLFSGMEDIVSKVSVEIYLAPLHRRADGLHMSEVNMRIFLWSGKGNWHGQHIMFSGSFAGGLAHSHINVGTRDSVWTPLWKAEQDTQRVDPKGAGYTVFTEMFVRTARNLQEATVAYSFQLPKWATERVQAERLSAGRKLLSNGMVSGLGHDEDEARMDAVMACREAGVNVKNGELVIISGDSRVKPLEDLNFIIRDE